MNIAAIHALFISCDGFTTDTRSIEKNMMYFALKGENFDGNTFTKQALDKGAKYCIIDNPDFKINEHCILVDNVLETLQKLATYHRQQLHIPIIALTGSNGKTTTKELIDAVLSKQYKTTATKGNLNNHIGVPLTLLSMTSQTEIGIVEMGANHLKEIALLSEIAQPNYGLITNFGKAHLEGFGSEEGVVQGKSELYQFLITHNQQIFVNNNDHKQLNLTKYYTNVIAYGNDCILGDTSNRLSITYKGQSFKTQLTGSYNFSNIQAAIAIGHYFKVSTNQIIEAVSNYNPNNNRSQILSKAGHTIILDAYNANPSSMKAALEHFKQIKAAHKIIILGDMLELGRYSKEEHQNIVDLAESLSANLTLLLGPHFNSCATNKAETFIDFNALTDYFKSQVSNLKNSTILIKGSRRMALERLIDTF